MTKYILFILTILISGYVNAKEFNYQQTDEQKKKETLNAFNTSLDEYFWGNKVSIDDIKNGKLKEKTYPSNLDKWTVNDVCYIINLKEPSAKENNMQFALTGYRRGLIFAIKSLSTPSIIEKHQINSNNINKYKDLFSCFDFTSLYIEKMCSNKNKIGNNLFGLTFIEYLSTCLTEKGAI